MEPNILIIISISLIICVIIYAVVHSFESNETQSHENDLSIRQSEWIKNNNINNSALSRCGLSCFFVDADNEILYVSNKMLANSSSPFIEFPFQSVIGSETIIDDETITYTKGGVGRAIVGGVLAGGAGAIIGASTAKKVSKSQINSYKVVIYLDDFNRSRFEFKLNEYTISTDSSLYQQANRFSEELNAAVKVILARNERNASINTERLAIKDPEQNNPPQLATPKQELPRNRIAELKSEYEKGNITKEEYEERRKKLARVCNVCKGKPIVAVKVDNGEKRINAFLCENCMHLIAKRARVEVVASTSSQFPKGYVEGSTPSSAEDELDSFEFTD